GAGLDGVQSSRDDGIRPRRVDGNIPLSQGAQRNRDRRRATLGGTVAVAPEARRPEPEGLRRGLRTDIRGTSGRGQGAWSVAWFGCGPGRWCPPSCRAAEGSPCPFVPQPPGAAERTPPPVPPA